LVPHAVLIGVTALEGAVVDDAGLDALLTSPAVVASEAGTADRAAALAEAATALANGEEAALDDTLAGVPVALVVGDATRLGKDLTASRLANGVLLVPLTVLRICGAATGGAVAVTATELAAARGVTEHAHSRLGAAFNTRAHAPACLLAR
jgi:hypothetical protein